MMRQNPYRFHTPPGWNEIRSAPRDGTVIEIQNNYGVAPSFGLFRWTESKWGGEGGWVSATDPNSGIGGTDDAWLSWKSHNGPLEAYRDPTGGAQNTRAYWIEACGLNPRDYPGSERTFEEEAKLDRAKRPAIEPPATRTQFRGGPSAIEYALIWALIAVAIIAAVQMIGGAP